MKFRPLHDRVVVRRIDTEEKTAGGIIIPDTAKEKPQQGEVLAVGPGKRDETGKLVALDVREGDQILFGKWSGTEVKIDGEDLLIMKEDDITGVVESAAPNSRTSGSATSKVGAIAAVLVFDFAGRGPFVFLRTTITLAYPHPHSEQGDMITIRSTRCAVRASTST